MFHSKLWNLPRGYVEKIGNNHENLWFFWGLSRYWRDLDSYYSTKFANTSSGMGCLRSRQCWRTRNHHELDLMRSFHGTSGLLNIHYSIPFGKCKTMQNQHVAVAQKIQWCASDSFVPCSLHLLLLFLSVRFIPNKHLLLVSLETRLLSNEGKILSPARTCQHPDKVIKLLSPGMTTGTCVHWFNLLSAGTCLVASPQKY